MIIEYCKSCGLRISEADYTEGRAFKIAGSEPSCSKCTPHRPSSNPRLPSISTSPTSAFANKPARPVVIRRFVVTRGEWVPLLMSGLVLTLAVLVFYATSQQSGKAVAKLENVNAIMPESLASIPISSRSPQSPRENLAEARLIQAITLLKEKREAEASTLLNEIIIEYHGNKYATEASRILRTINSSKPESVSKQESPTSDVTPESSERWTSLAVGTRSSAGTSFFKNGVFTIGTLGGNIGRESDDFQYLYRMLKGDGEIIVKLESFSSSYQWAKTGIMVRESADTVSPYYSIVLSGTSNDTILRQIYRRSSETGAEAPKSIKGSIPLWLKVSRKGDLFSSAQSDDGAVWSSVGAQRIPMKNTIFIGIVACSIEENKRCTAKYSNVSLSTAE